MRYLVVGSGIRGICDCIAILREDSDAKVCLIDAATKFGGAVSGLAVEDFAVDPGVHLFDSIPRDFAQFLDNILPGGMSQIEVKSASTFNRSKTDGFSLPDLSTLPVDMRVIIQDELLSRNASVPDFEDNLRGLFLEKFGASVSDIYSGIYKHIFSITSSEVSREAIHSTSLHRLKYDSDEEMMRLKMSSDRLDSVLAARRSVRDTSAEDSVTVYPSDGRGMAGLNQDIQAWLCDAGVDIKLGVSISSVEKNNSSSSSVVLSDGEIFTADRIIWSANNFDFVSHLCGEGDTSISDFMHYAPMVLAVLVGEERGFSDYTYMQNFDVGRVTYRSASAGRYSNQVRDGRTFVTCECPTSIGSEYWLNHNLLREHLIRDLAETGFMQADHEVDAYFFNAPKTFFAPKVGFGKHFERLSLKAWNDFGIFVKDPRVFFRREMIEESRALAENGFERNV